MDETVMQGTLLVWASWCLTYLLHSTILLGAAWLLARVLGMRRLGVQDFAFKCALVGGIVTATAQTGMAAQPLSGDFVIAPASAAERDVAPARVAPPAAVPAVPAVAPEATISPAQPSEPAARRSWLQWLALGWMLVASFLLVRLAHAWTGLRMLLADRLPLRDVISQLLLSHLQRVAGSTRRVRQSTSGRVPVPIAFGTLHPEICVPERVTQLSPDERSCIIAHELAHVLRLDPLWTLVARGIESVLFFQPLNRMAARRIAHLSEYLADDCAVRWTGDRHSLATSLAAVARWVAPTRLPVPAMAGSPAVLHRRIRRIVERQSTMKALKHRRLSSLPLALLGFAGLALVLPRVSSARWSEPQIHVETSGDSGGYTYAVADGVTVAIASGDDVTTIVLDDEDGDDAGRKGKAKQRKAKRKRKKAKRKAKRKAKGKRKGKGKGKGEATHMEVRGSGSDVRIYVDGKEMKRRHQQAGKCKTFEQEGVKIVVCADGDTVKELERAHRHWQRRMSELQHEYHRQSREVRREVERAKREHAARAAEHAQRQAERAAEIAREHALRAQEVAERARRRAEEARREAEQAAERAHREAERARERAHRERRGRHRL